MRVLLPKLREVIKAVNTQHGPAERVALSTIATSIREQGVVHRLLRVPAEIDIGCLVGQYTQLVSDDGIRTGTILHKKYDVSRPFGDPSYPEIRFGLAKEMLHAFDSEEEKTKQHQAVVDLAEALLAKDLMHGQAADYYADRRAVFGAIELLVRFELRQVMVDTSFSISRCRTTGDWTPVAKMFGVPEWVASVAFNPKYIDYIKTLRHEANIQNHDFYPHCGL